MYEEETELVKLVEKTLREAKKSPEKINHSMAGVSLGPKPVRKQSKVYVEDFGFDERPVVRRNRSKSDPYTGSFYPRTNSPLAYNRSVSNDLNLSASTDSSQRTRKFSLFNAQSNKVGPIDVTKNGDRPNSEGRPCVKDSRTIRPQSDQSPRQPGTEEKVKETESETEAPELKAAWDNSGVYV